MGLLTIFAILVSLAAIDNSVRKENSFVSNLLNRYESGKKDLKRFRSRE